MDFLARDGEKLVAPFERVGDAAKIEEAFAGPCRVGRGGFECLLVLRNGKAFGAFQFTIGGAAGGKVVDFRVDAFKCRVAAFGGESGMDLEGTSLMEKGHIAGDLVAESAFFAEFEKESRARGFAQHEAEQAQCVALRGVAAGGVPCESELELIGIS